jgi:hypothetical protein
VYPITELSWMLSEWIARNFVFHLVEATSYTQDGGLDTAVLSSCYPLFPFSSHPLSDIIFPRSFEKQH